MKKVLIVFGSVVLFIIIMFLLLGSYESRAEELLQSYQNYPGTFISISFLLLVLDIILPIPSTIIMYLNGFVMGLLIGTIVSFISLLCSSICGYAIGKTLNKSNYEKYQRFYDKYGPSAIILTRGMPIMAEAISIMCGYIRIPFRRFLFFQAIGYLPVCLIYAYLGTIANENEAFLPVLGISIIITILFWLYGTYIQKKQPSSNFEMTK